MISEDHPAGERTFVSFPTPDFQKTRRQLLTWAARAEVVCFLDSQGYPDGMGGGFQCLLAVGVKAHLETNAGHAFGRLRTWALEHRDWLFGHFAYELAAETEPGSIGSAQRADPVGFPDLYFFVPDILIELSQTVVRIGCFQDRQELIWKEIMAVPVEDDPWRPAAGDIPSFVPRFTPGGYRERVAELQQHILRGDCYEINFCQEFYSQPADLAPLGGWWSLSRASPNPFSCFYRLNERYLLCASPERYLKKTGSRLFSQPIKGTAARHPDRPAADAASASHLFQSAKDRSENVMIVDLVRNDFAKVCQPGSVVVEELFGVYAFPQVFQMISSISGMLAPGRHWTDAIRETFPMGSMTGAPKRRVVGLIDQYERSRRGIFSGAVGYVTPEGDFDFNVVIRSLMYNRAERYLSYQVGSGITFYSSPEAEYEECLVKVRGILTALGMQ